jgi:hypothetical protein
MVWWLLTNVSLIYVSQSHFHYYIHKQRIFNRHSSIPGCELCRRGRQKSCAWGMFRFSLHKLTWRGFDYSHHSPWFVHYHINFYDLKSTEQDALSWNQLHFQPKDHERVYIPFLKINLFIPTALCGTQMLIWRQVGHDTDQWQYVWLHDYHMHDFCNKPPSYHINQSTFGRINNNDHASCIHQYKVLKNHDLTF